MQAPTTLRDLAEPEGRPHLVWVACRDCGQSLGRHEVYIDPDESRIDPETGAAPLEIIGYIGLRREPRLGEPLTDFSDMRIRASKNTQQTRSQMRARGERGPRTGPGLYGFMRPDVYPRSDDEVAYVLRRCYCDAGRPPRKRRADKLGALPVRFDADGRAWIDF